MDAEPSPRAPPRLTEEDAARAPAALAGREQLEARLARLSADRRDAFRAAVRRCYVFAGKG
ncbi:hypothetical protein ABS772_08300 [Methylorubrum podarium]|uniref:Uncharacterized protein n=1 Tax=Methylorubrum podarium TaxID=200476 RepID=A0ABV1QKJ0_9HYPH